MGFHLKRVTVLVQVKVGGIKRTGGELILLPA
jgi:hypothetical protein